MSAFRSRRRRGKHRRSLLSLTANVGPTSPHSATASARADTLCGAYDPFLTAQRQLLAIQRISPRERLDEGLRLSRNTAIK